MFKQCLSKRILEFAALNQVSSCRKRTLALIGWFVNPRKTLDMSTINPWLATL